MCDFRHQYDENTVYTIGKKTQVIVTAIVITSATRLLHYHIS